LKRRNCHNNVTAIDKNGNISELIQLILMSTYPFAWITIAGISGRYDSKHEIEKIEKIELNYPFDVKGNPYQFLEFTGFG